jgi:hypothetical protein
MGEICNTFIRKPDIDETTRGTRCISDDNIKMDVREMEYECVDWLHVSQVRDHWQVSVKTIANVRVS